MQYPDIAEKRETYARSICPEGTELSTETAGTLLYLIFLQMYQMMTSISILYLKSACSLVFVHQIVNKAHLLN